jgi:hypothetical protein
MSLCPRRPQIRRATRVPAIDRNSARLWESLCAGQVARKTARKLTLLNGSSKNVHDEVRSHIDQ